MRNAKYALGVDTVARRDERRRRLDSQLLACPRRKRTKREDPLATPTVRTRYQRSHNLHIIIGSV